MKTSLLAVLFIPVAVQAATVQGTVTAAGVGPIVDTVVEFVDGGGAVASDTTDIGGMYALAVPNGTYDVRVTPPSASGLDPKTLPDHLVRGDGILDIVLVPSVRRTYSGLVTQGGVPQPSVQISLTDTQGRFITSVLTDAAGRFSVQVAPGSYNRYVFYWIGRQSFILSVEGLLDLSAPVDESFELDGARRKQVRGVVRDPDGNPVPGAPVTLVGRGIGFPPYAFVSQNSTQSTDAAGRFAFLAYPGTMQDLRAMAPAGSSLTAAALLIDVLDDVDVTITLGPARPLATYSGTILTDGAPLAGAFAYLCDTDACVSSARTGADGGFALTMPQGQYSRGIGYGHSEPPPRPSSSSYSFWVPGVLQLNGPLAEDFDVEGSRRHALNGTVVDPDGNPLPNLSLSLQMEAVAFGEFNYGRQYGSLATDSAGRFSFQLYPGSGTLRSQTFAGSGLSDFLVDVTMGEADRSLGILLQFLADTADCPSAQPGAACGTGTSPSPADPVETVVETPADGIVRTVSISEEPIALAPPGGFRFLTQQVKITATPAASAAQPFRIAFAFDASRIPPGEDETTLQVFRNGAAVPPCSDASGVAAPDPCVALRDRLPDGDVRLIVLTSNASIWNVGQALPAPFLCYGAKRAKGDLCAAEAPQGASDFCEDETDCGGVSGVTMLCRPNTFPKAVTAMVDGALGSALVDVGAPQHLCNPADVDDERAGDPATHLQSHPVKLAKTTPRQTKPEPSTGIVVENRFHPARGALVLDAVAVDRLLIPAATRLGRPAPPLSPIRLDDHACYKTKLSQGAAKFPKDVQVTMRDEFDQPKRYDVVKPTRLCIPVRTLGRPILHGDDHLVCYQVKPARGEPAHRKVEDVFVADRLATAVVRTTGEGELCVPSRTRR